MDIIKIIIIGPTGAGKSSLARHIVANPLAGKHFEYSAIDHFRQPGQDIHAEYVCKMNFVSRSVQHCSTIVECSGMGITSSLLVSGLRNLIETIPTLVFPFYLNTPNGSPPPRYTTINFREFNPVVLPWATVQERYTRVKRHLNQVINHNTPAHVR